MRFHATVVIFLQFFATVVFSGSLLLYSGNQCTDPNPITINGTDDGLCTQIPVSFWSMKVGALNPGCAITVYGVNNSYCGLGYKYALNQEQCYGNESATSISQLSVDCASTDITPAAPSEPPSSPPPTNAGLSTSAKIGVGLGVPLAVLAVITCVAVLCFLRRRKRRSATTNGEDAAVHPPLQPVEAGTESEKRTELQDTAVRELYGESKFELSGDQAGLRSEQQHQEVTPNVTWEDSTTETKSAR